MLPRHQRLAPKASTGFEASLVFVLTIVCLSFAAGLSAASPSPMVHVRSLSAPYRGVSFAVNKTSIAGCGSVSVTHAGAFHLRNGAGGFDANASAASCVSYGTSSGSAVTEFGAGIDVPFHRGTPTIYGNVSYSLSYNLTYSAGVCHVTNPKNWQCTRSSYVVVYATAFLVNRTTNYSWGLPGFFLVDEEDAIMTQCQGGTCSTFSQSAPNGTQVVSGSHSFNFTMPVPMLKSTRYYFGIEVLCEVLAGDSVKHATVTGFTGASRLDFTRHGKGIDLISVTET